MDEIYTDLETRESAHSDVSSTGIISSLSSHGSPEATTQVDNNETFDRAENFCEPIYPGPRDATGAAGELDVKMGQLNVQDEQEGEYYCSQRTLYYMYYKSLQGFSLILLCNFCLHVHVIARNNSIRFCRRIKSCCKLC